MIPMVSIDQLTALIEEALRPFGYQQEPERPKANGYDTEASEDPWRRLNQLALANLDKWVPQLGLDDCVRLRDGRYAAVPSFRPSPSGKARRDRSLGISSSGIKDFGQDKGYTPIDLVMLCGDLDFAGAVAWLDERLGWSEGGPEIRIDPEPAEEKPQSEEPQASQDAPKGEQAKGEQPDPDAALVKEFLEGMWACGDPPPPMPAWLIYKLIGECSLGLLCGKFSTFKTFLLTALAVAAMTGTKFAGRRVVKTGGVLFVTLEDQDATYGRLRAALEQAGASQDTIVPFLHIDKFPPLLMKAVRNPRSMRQIHALMRVINKLMMERYGVPLVMVCIDNLSLITNFTNENSSAEGIEAMKMLREGAEAAKVSFVVIDHHGKNDELGARGTSAKGQNADFILASLGDEDDGRAGRKLKFTKVRSATKGEVAGFSMNGDIVVGKDAEGLDVTTLAVEWTGPAADDDKPSQPKERPYAQVMFLRALLKATKTAPACVPGTSLVGATLYDTRKAFNASYTPRTSDGTKKPHDARMKAFGRAQEALQEQGAIELLVPEGDSSHEADILVWVPL